MLRDAWRRVPRGVVVLGFVSLLMDASSELVHALLPLVLVAVGPLLIASFVYNFNNFNLIYLFIQGGPPIAGASTQAGSTDILLSYVYKLAFESSGRGVLYGLASAISIIVFFIVGIITLLQYNITNMWEEVSENV